MIRLLPRTLKCIAGGASLRKNEVHGLRVIEKTIIRTEIMLGINRRRVGANAPIRNAGEDDPSRARRKIRIYPEGLDCGHIFNGGAVAHANQLCA
jgi:hypothetical protein